MVTKYSSTKEKRKARVRSKIKGTSDKPRVSVFRSNRFIYVQAIDDVKGSTMAAGSNKRSVDESFKVGSELAANLKKLKIEKIVFDRGPYAYHGIVKRLADGLRESGIKF